MKQLLPSRTVTTLQLMHFFPSSKQRLSDKAPFFFSNTQYFEYSNEELNHWDIKSPPKSSAFVNKETLALIWGKSLHCFSRAWLYWRLFKLSGFPRVPPPACSARMGFAHGLSSLSLPIWLSLSLLLSVSPSEASPRVSFPLCRHETPLSPLISLL